jgi:hypothetical protein
MFETKQHLIYQLQGLPDFGTSQGTAQWCVGCSSLGTTDLRFEGSVGPRSGRGGPYKFWGEDGKRRTYYRGRRRHRKRMWSSFKSRTVTCRRGSDGPVTAGGRTDKIATMVRTGRRLIELIHRANHQDSGHRGCKGRHRNCERVCLSERHSGRYSDGVGGSSSEQKRTTDHHRRGL